MPIPLADWLGDSASAPEIAVAVLTIWNVTDDALTPVLGGRGLVALYRRTLHLTAQAYAAQALWPEAPAEIMAANTPTGLQVLIAHQNAESAAALGACFLQTFHDLVAGLVGPSLTERLLQKPWTHAPRDAPAQAPSP